MESGNKFSLKVDDSKTHNKDVNKVLYIDLYKMDAFKFPLHKYHLKIVISFLF